MRRSRYGSGRHVPSRPIPSVPAFRPMPKLLSASAVPDAANASATTPALIRRDLMFLPRLPKEVLEITA